MGNGTRKEVVYYMAFSNVMLEFIQEPTIGSVNCTSRALEERPIWFGIVLVIHILMMQERDQIQPENENQIRRNIEDHKFTPAEYCEKDDKKQDYG